ncbi:protein dispatched homolog 3-like [Ptychodera flava]|uniref:protein dispatched homolog 3-like n=1 Tax=Ptychodera flava TaxID=63121 RepID=UPI00396A97BC
MSFLGDTEVCDFTNYRHYDVLNDDIRQDVTFSHHSLRLQVQQSPVSEDDDNAEDVAEGELYRHQVARQREQENERNHNPPSVEHGSDPFKGSHFIVKKIWHVIGKIFANPVVSVFILISCKLVVGLLLWHSLTHYELPHIDISLDAFQIPNHPSSLRQDALDTAFKDMMSRHRRDTEDAEQMIYTGATEQKQSVDSIYKKFFSRLPSEIKNSPAYPVDGTSRSKREIIVQHRVPRWKMTLVYLAKGNNHDNIFTSERLAKIHEIEQKIMGHDQFSDFCVKNSISYGDKALEVIDHCAPINSLMTYFFPSEVSGEVLYDGMGSHLADINGSLTKAMAHPSFYWYVDENMSKHNPKSKLLRSEVMFGTPIRNFMWPDGIRKSEAEQHEEYTNFIVSYADMLDKESSESIMVLYGGTELFDWEVQQTFYHDISMGAISGALIFLLVFILTSFSLWLTIYGFISIATSFGLAFVVYRVVFAYESFGILNGISIFVVIGIGVDDVFVFINTFRQSKHIQTLYERMAFTIRTAGTATLFTSFTTAAAFGANISSQIPAIHDFGLFMALVVSSCWVTVILIMPPALCIWHYAFEPCETCCFKPCSKKSDSESNRPSRQLYRVLMNHENGVQRQRHIAQGTTLDDGEDADIQMLDIEGNGVGDMSLLHDDDDVPLLDIGNASESSPVDLAEKDSGCGVTNLSVSLQHFLYRKIGLPIIRARLYVVGSYIVVLIISIALLSQLKPASKPPELFKEDTNLQQLINIAFNFSGEDIHCDQCSGLFVEDPEKAPDLATQAAVIIPSRGVDAGRAAPTTKSAVAREITTVTPTMPLPLDEKTTKARMTCKDIKCEFGGVCKENRLGNMEAGCDCDLKCDSSVKSPVCSTDDVTYDNECLLETDRCINQHRVVKAHKGPCKADIPSPDKPDDDSHSSSDHNTPSKPDHNPGGGKNKPLPSQASPNTGYNPCANDGCAPAAARPILNNGAMVYVVFGINHIDRTNMTGEHVLAEGRGSVIYGKPLDFTNPTVIKQLCTICKNIALSSNPKLVKEGGAQCYPPGYDRNIPIFASLYPECKDLPVPRLLSGQKSHAMAERQEGGSLLFKWYAMAFESTTFKGKSSFSAYKDYLEWEKLLSSELDKLPADSPLKNGFQTCDFWKQMFMEVLGVTSAIYGLVFSLFVCVVSVAVFTGHIGLSVIVMLTILGVILLAVGLFYTFGWEMGAVEALSLSILVGSSVDYCAHLVEGYLLAGSFLPTNLHMNKEKRQWRTGAAISHIGVSILSSAVTTIIAAIPLCMATIEPFSKFGEIVALNTLLSILYTLTACVGFLSLFAPAKYTWNIKWLLITLLIVAIGIGSLFAAAYIAFVLGVPIPGPTGDSLFPHH